MRALLPAFWRRLPDLALFIAFIFPLAVLLGPLSSLADLVGQFLFQAAIGTLLAGIVLGLRGRRLRGIVMMLIVLFDLVLLAPGWPARRATAADGEGVLVLFSNLLMSNAERDEAIDTIRSTDADIIVLAELGRRWYPLLDGLHEAYPYSIDCRDVPRCDIAILSRRPLSEARVDSDQDSYLVSAIADTPMGPLAVGGTHFDRPLPQGRLRKQMNQARFVIEHSAGRDLPMILAGDFNAVPWGRVVSLITSEGGFEARFDFDGTWPAGLPWPLRIPIDHLMTRGGSHYAARTLIDMPGSDHKAVLARIALKAGDGG